MAGAFRRVPIWITVSGLDAFPQRGRPVHRDDRHLRRRCPRCAADRQDRCRRNTEACRIDQRHIGRCCAEGHRASPITSPKGRPRQLRRLRCQYVPIGKPSADTLDTVIEVGPGETCQSACVGLLALAPGTISVAPTATLMFHSAAQRVGLGTRGPCGWLNEVTIRIGRWLQPSTPEMLPWASD